jgi:hypothetical protein
VSWARPTSPITSRVAYAAAHVAVSTGLDHRPGIDWEATLAFRHGLWSWGLGVAEAMDTAQRGMGLSWADTQELIRRSGAEAASVGGRLVCGAGTDQLPPGVADLGAIADAWRSQVAVVREAGAGVVLMASRALAAAATGPDDYLRAYATVLDEVDEPVVLHWLGPMFDPALAGYWGSADLDSAGATLLDLLSSYAAKVDGVKVSLLDASREVALREALPAGVRLYTGDDLNYPSLIVGDGAHHSDALLGVFAAIAPAASTALQALDAGDPVAARSILDSTVELGRHVFGEPTRFYKTGIAFLAWLNGHQPEFRMLDGLETARSLAHLVRTHDLARRADLLDDPDLAARRLRTLLEAHR